MVDQVVLLVFFVGLAEVDAVGLGDLGELVLGPRQVEDPWVEICGWVEGCVCILEGG